MSPRCIFAFLCVLSRVWLFMTPMDCSLPWNFEGKNTKVASLSFSRGSFPPKDRICLSCVSCNGRWILYHCATWEAPRFIHRVASGMISVCSWLNNISLLYIYILYSFPGGSDNKESACNAGDPGLIPGWERSPGEGNGNPLQYSCSGESYGPWQPTPIFLPGESHGLRRLVGCSPQGHKESDTTGWLYLLMGSQRVGQGWSNLEGLHHSPSQFVCSLPDLPREFHEISSLFQTSFSTFSSGHCFHSRFLLNMVLHFQQSITEAEISLPYLTPKVEQKKLQEFWLR